MSRNRDAPITAPAYTEYMNSSINRAVRKKIWRNPITFWSGATGVGAGLGALVLMGFPLAFPLAVVSVLAFSVSGGCVITRMFFMSDKMASEHYAELKQRERLAQEQNKRVIRDQIESYRDFEDLKDVIPYMDQALNQFDHAETGYKDLLKLLDQQLNRSETAYAMFFENAVELFHSVVDNLNRVAMALYGLKSIDCKHVNQRLSILENQASLDENDERELKALKRRMEVRREQVVDISRFLTTNEEAMTVLEESTAQITRMKTGSTFAKSDIDTVIDRMQSMIQVSKSF